MEEQRETVSIQVERSAKRQILNPEYLLLYDKIFMKRGEVFLVTKADADRVELMMVSRKTLKREDLPAFAEHINFVERADCFEKG